MNKILLFVSFLLSASLTAYNQDNASVKKLGLGIHVNQIKSTDLYTAKIILPSNKLILTYNLSPKFRLEAEVGLIYTTKTTDSGSEKYTGWHLGISPYILKTKEKFLVYYGLNLAWDNVYHKYSLFASEQYEENRYYLGPSIGGEYFFGKHFSLAAELGLSVGTSKYLTNQYRGSESNEFIIISDSGLIIRFYF